jgi:hypothetical protein
MGVGARAVVVDKAGMMGGAMEVAVESDREVFSRTQG